MSNKFLFTEKAIKALPLPEKDRVEYFDTKEASLQLRVSKTGVKTFYWFRWVKSDQKTERVMIGQCKDISIETARRKCDEFNGMMALGENPNAKKRAMRADITYEDFFENEYMPKWAMREKRSWKNDEGRFKKWIKGQWFGKKKLNQITKMDVSQLHHEAATGFKWVRKKKDGKEEGVDLNGGGANRVLALVSASFTKAVQWGRVKENPALGLSRFNERRRQRIISRGGEFTGFWTALHAFPDLIKRDFFYTALLTGIRKMNVLCMHENDLFFTHEFSPNPKAKGGGFKKTSIGVWVIKQTKNNDPKYEPLSRELTLLLKRRIKLNKRMGYDNGHTKGWLFPAPASKTGHVVTPYKAWLKLLKNAGIEYNPDDFERLVIHDLRRTHGSYMAMEDVPINIIAKSLGQRSLKVTHEVYAHLSIDPVRRAKEIAQKAMFKYRKKEDG